MTRSFRSVAVAAVATFAVAASASLALNTTADARGWHPDHGNGGDMAMIMRHVGLTTQQKQQIHALLMSEHETTASTRQQLHAIHGQIEEALFSTGSVSANAMMPLVQKRDALKATLDQSRMATAIAIRDVLTASQLSAASSLHARLAALHAQEHALLAAPVTTAE